MQHAKCKGTIDQIKRLGHLVVTTLTRQLELVISLI